MHPRLIAAVILGGCLAAGQAGGQAPAVYENGVVNAASYGIGEKFAILDENNLVVLPSFGEGERPPGLVARGSIVSIFGENLADETLSAGLPLPTELGGTSVIFGEDTPLHLFFVSPGQINAQFPLSVLMFQWAANLTGFGVPIRVRTPRGESEPVLAYMPGIGGLGIFTLDASGCNEPAVLNVAADGSVSINSPENAASPGDYISVFGTGLGSLTDGRMGSVNPPDGHPAPPGAAVAGSRSPVPDFLA